ncbi:hypothetical protein X975_25007, partial [Stegodyphus mimosarum]
MRISCNVNSLNGNGALSKRFMSEFKSKGEGFSSARMNHVTDWRREGNISANQEKTTKTVLKIVTEKHG